MAYCSNCGAPVQQSGSAAAASPTAPTSGFDALTKDSRAQDYWVRRLVAFIFDAIIVYAVLFVITIIAAIPVLIAGALTGAFNPATLAFGGIFSWLWGLIFVLYFTVTEPASGSSFGKKIFGLRVTSKTGSNPSFSEAFVRNLSKVYWLLLLLDVVLGLALSKGYQRKWSDQFVGTTVSLKPS